MKTVPTQKKQSVIIGAGRLPVGEYWDRSVVSLAGEAVRLAVRDAGSPAIDAIYIGNAFASVLSNQANLGALIAESAAFPHCEAMTFEAAGASGGAAFRAALLAVESGWVRTAVAVGVEKITDVLTSEAEDAKNLTLNYEYEGAQGLSSDALAALLAARYLSDFEKERTIFSSIVLNDYENARTNPFARNRAGLGAERYARQAMTIPPLGMFDIAQMSDGAAAVVVTRPENVPASCRREPIRVLASANATSQLSIHDRHQLLEYRAAAESASRALNQAGLRLKQVDLFELGDESVIDLILTLEAIGLSRPGYGWKTDRLTLNRGGGNIGRGFPVGAAGVYQLIEAMDWLSAQGSPKSAFIQALGGRGATAVTHILAS